MTRRHRKPTLRIARRKPARRHRRTRTMNHCRPAETVEQAIVARLNLTARQGTSPTARPIPAQHNQGIRLRVMTPAQARGWPDHRRRLKPWLTTPTIRTWVRRWLTSSTLSAEKKAAQRWPWISRLGGITVGRLKKRSCCRQPPGSGPCCPAWCSRSGPGGIAVPATAHGSIWQPCTGCL